MPVEVKSSVVIAYPADLNFHSLDKLASSFNLEIPYLCFGLSFQVSFQRDRETGVTTVKYNIAKKTNLVVNGAPCVILNVKLHCNVQETPWCNNPDS